MGGVVGAAVLRAADLFRDFSGYSDMAIGLARMFGFRFPENFNYPYTATSIQDFWRQWHMMLSSWFRDLPLFPARRQPQGDLDDGSEPESGERPQGATAVRPRSVSRRLDPLAPLARSKGSATQVANFEETRAFTLSGLPLCVPRQTGSPVMTCARHRKTPKAWHTARGSGHVASTSPPTDRGGRCRFPARNRQPR